MTNGINFGTEGPQITGWWYNPTTGDKFNALDTYFEDNNLLIKAADGRLLNYNQIQNYVRVDDPKMIPDIKKQTKNVPKHDDIPTEILAELDNGDEGLLIPDDNIYGRPTKQDPAAELGNIYKGTESEALSPAIQDFAIIDRALNGKQTPNPIAQISWDEFPKREIEMLIDVMQISEDKIVQYYINSISIDTVKQMLNEGIKNYISTHLHEQKTVERSNSDNIENKTSSTTNKKTTKKK